MSDIDSVYKEVQGNVKGGIFFFNDTATTEIYTLSLHDALPISYIETYYNPVRPQAALNWLSPLAYEHLLSVYAAKVA